VTTKQLQRTTFKTSREMDFYNEKELVSQTGHSKDEWPFVIVKELVDNALDACEEGGIAPKIEVKIDESGIAISDNGPGIPAKTIEDIFDFSIRVSSREAYVSPTRGAQGNALKTILAMPFVLTGEYGRVDISAHDVCHEIEISVDQIKQKPTIKDQKKKCFVKTGTSVKVYWRDLASSELEDEKDRFLQFVESFTWLNPQLTLSVDWYGQQQQHQATDVDWKKWPPNRPTCSHWYKYEDFERLALAYIKHDKENGNRDRTIREFISEFRGLSGSRKQKSVLDELGKARTCLSEMANEKSVDRESLKQLLTAVQNNTTPVKPRSLGLIGKKHFEEKCQNIGCNMDSFQYRKDIGEKDGIPRIIETVFAWAPERKQRLLIPGVNWSPGIRNPFRILGKFGKSLDSVLEQQRAGEDEPIVLIVHMSCPRVQYSDRGKSSVVA